MTEAGGLLPDITVTPGAHIMNIEIDLDSVTLDPKPITTAIGAAAAMTHIGVDQDHSTGFLTATSPVIEAPALTTTVMIHPTTDIPRNASRDDSRSHHRSRKHHYKLARGSSSSSHTASWKSKDRKHKQVTIDDPSLDYYSSDDTNSNSDDDLN